MANEQELHAFHSLAVLLPWRNVVVAKRRARHRRDMGISPQTSRRLVLSDYKKKVISPYRIQNICNRVPSVFVDCTYA